MRNRVEVGSMMETVKLILMIAELFFVLYLIGYSSFVSVSVIVGALHLYGENRSRAIKERLDIRYEIPVSIIVPAYNEEVSVVDTVTSLLRLKNNRYEIIVVDDGSTDETTRVLIQHFHLREVPRPCDKLIPCKDEIMVYETYAEKVPITVVRKWNGGKSDALNMGINVARYDYFMCIDADSMLQDDSLDKITLPILERSDIAAVGGLVRISNDCTFQDGHLVTLRIPRNALAAMQMVEYGKSFFASRILMDRFNGNLIISGAFGLFRRDLVIQAGGYSTDTMGEDMELVMKLHAFCRINRIDYAIRYEPEAVCWTQAPEKTRELLRQRRRWHIGLMQCMEKYRDMCLNPDYGAVGVVSYVYFLLYELLSPIIEIGGMLVTLLAAVFRLINFNYMVLFLLIYSLFGAILSLTVFLARSYVDEVRLSFLDSLRAILLCILEMVLLRPLVSLARMNAILTRRRNNMKWGTITRKKQTA